MSRYNVTLELPSEQITPGFMDVGIHENVEMTKVEYGKSSNGNEFLAFYFKNESGETGSHTEWVPKGNSNEEIEKKEANQMSRIKQIAKTFIPLERFVFSANDFEEFAKKTIQVLGESYKGVKIRVKMVYSGKYTSLPKPWKPRFIERMDNNGYYGDAQGESKIKILSIDPMVRPVADDTITTKNPFEVTSPSLSTSNSPF